MIESNNPEIDVNQLMERIRAEVARRRDLGLLQRNGSGHAVSPGLPQVHFLAPLPPMVSPRRIDVKEGRLTSILQRAREKTEVSKRIPKLLRRLFRKQGGYNKLLLESVAVLTGTNVELNKRFQEWAGAFEIQNRWLSDLSSARDADAAWMRAAATIINAVKEKNVAVGEEFRTLRSEFDKACEHLRNLQAQADGMREQEIDWAVRATNALADQMNVLEHKNVAAGEEFQVLRSEFDRAGEHLRNLQTEVDRFAEFGTRADDLGRHLSNLQVQTDNQDRHLNNLQTQADAVTADSPILDLGCGRGEWLELVNENGLAGEGVDSNAIMVSACQERGLRVIEGDALEYLRALPAESRGAITAFHLIEHLEFQL